MKRISLLISIIIMICLLICGTYAAYADTYSTYKTGEITGTVNIRTGTSSEYKILGKGYKNDLITLKGEKTGKDGTKWYRITYDGKAAYVSSKYVKKVNTLPYTIYTPAKNGKVTGSAGIVRTNSSTSSTILGKMHKYDYFKIKGYKKSSGGTTWYRVSYNGKDGYVSSKTTKTVIGIKYDIYTPYKEGSVKASGVNVRSGAGTSYKQLGKLSKGERVTIRGEKKSSTGAIWYRVLYGGKAGYVSKVNITMVTASDYYTMTPNKAGNIRSDKVTLRKQPSNTSGSLGTLDINKAVEVKGYTYDENGSCWYYVKAKNKSGFVKSSSVAKIAEISSETTEYAVADADLNVRSGAGTEYAIIGSMSKGSQAPIKGSQKDKSGTLWYRISFGGGTGYVISTYISKKTVSSSGDAMFEAEMIEEGFPESYKSYLRTLHALYPEWIFKAQNANISWSDAVTAETKLGRSLVNTSYSAWKSMARGAYDWTHGRYVTFDSGNWVTAVPGLVKYYLDPRNFINDTYIFMFLDHAYDGETQDVSTVKKVVKGTFLDGKMPGTEYTYAYYINKAAKNAGMNPNVLASMILQEQGSSGNSNLISGTCYGYKGLYNYLNIGAYAASGMSAVQRGLWWAAGAGSGDTSYGRPWNTRYKAIYGGALYYTKQYVAKNQNTLYLKKFNIMNGKENLGLHQYMTNIQGAASEAVHLKSAYGGLTGTPMVFSIPVYRNMTSGAAKLPGTSGTNNNFLSSIKVTDDNGKSYALSTSFDRYDQSYSVTIPDSIKKITVNAKKSSQNAVMTGTGTYTLDSGNKTISIKVTSSSGLIRTYKVTVKH